MKEIFKLILLWFTALSIITLVCSIDNWAMGTILIWGVVNLFLSLVICSWLTYDDIYKLSGSKWLNERIQIIDE